MILNDEEIRQFVQKYRMIEPFIPRKSYWLHAYEAGPAVLAQRPLQEGEYAVAVPSFGLEPAGYTFRLGIRARVFSQEKPHPPNWQELFYNLAQEGQYYERAPFVLHPGDFALVESLEWFRIPACVQAFIYPKSTWSRCGLLLLTAPVDAGWEGRLTFGIKNAGPQPVVLHHGVGIAQMVFHWIHEPSQPYKGRYMGTTMLVGGTLTGEEEEE